MIVFGCTISMPCTCIAYAVAWHILWLDSNSSWKGTKFGLIIIQFGMTMGDRLCKLMAFFATWEKFASLSTNRVCGQVDIFKLELPCLRMLRSTRSPHLRATDITFPVSEYHIRVHITSIQAHAYFLNWNNERKVTCINLSAKLAPSCEAKEESSYFKCE